MLLEYRLERKRAGRRDSRRKATHCRHARTAAATATARDTRMMDESPAAEPQHHGEQPPRKPFLIFEGDGVWREASLEDLLTQENKSKVIMMLGESTMPKGRSDLLKSLLGECTGNMYQHTFGEPPVNLTTLIDEAHESDSPEAWKRMVCGAGEWKATPVIDLIKLNINTKKGVAEAAQSDIDNRAAPAKSASHVPGAGSSGQVSPLRSHHDQSDDDLEDIDTNRDTDRKRGKFAPSERSNSSANGSSSRPGSSADAYGPSGKGNGKGGGKGSGKGGSRDGAGGKGGMPALGKGKGGKGGKGGPEPIKFLTDDGGPYAFLALFHRAEVKSADGAVQFDSVGRLFNYEKMIEMELPSIATLVREVEPPRVAHQIRNLTCEDGTWEAAGGAVAHHLVAKWNAARRSVLRPALRQKFAKENMRTKLLGTGDAVLIEDSRSSDSQIHAELLMELRDELKAEAVQV